jgi:transposase
MKQDRFDHNDDHSDVTKPVRTQRIEVITGVERRRRWPRDKKLAIVAESFQDGCRVADVARRHGISPQQLFGWRGQLRAELEPAPAEVPLFAPAIVDASVPPPAEAVQAPSAPDTSPSIEIVLGPAVVRVRGTVDPRMLAMILRALKVSR